MIQIILRMAQVSKYPIRKEIADGIFELFIKSLIHVGDRKETEQFVSDLFTPTERIMLAKRLSIAFLLEKDYRYRTIQNLLRVSLPTIATVNLTRKYGSKGYKKLIEKISKEESLDKFLGDLAIKLVSAPAKASRGAGVWRYLKGELEEEKRKKQKPF